MALDNSAILAFEALYVGRLFEVPSLVSFLPL